MKKEYERTGLIVNVILAVVLLLSLIGDHYISDKLQDIYYTESNERLSFIDSYNDAILDYLLLDAGQVALVLEDVYGKVDVKFASDSPYEIVVVNKKDNKSAEFTRLGLLDNALDLKGHEFINYQQDYARWKFYGTLLFHFQVILILFVIFLNLISFTFFKNQTSK